MTDRQKRFCTEYLKDLNATQAAIRAGYAPKYAGRSASHTMKNEEVRAELRRALDAVNKKNIARSEDVLAYFTKLMRGEIYEEKIVIDEETGEETVLVDASENFVRTVDPHRSWGQYAVYQVDRSLYVYDLEEQAKRKLFTYERDWGFYNYQIMDGHVIAICGTEDTCRAWAVDIADGSVIELDTRGGNVVAFGANYECNGYFAGLKRNSSGDFEQCYISKEDYYRSNYDAAFR